MLRCCFHHNFANSAVSCVEDQVKPLLQQCCGFRDAAIDYPETILAAEIVKICNCFVCLDLNFSAIKIMLAFNRNREKKHYRDSWRNSYHLDNAMGHHHQSMSHSKHIRQRDKEISDLVLSLSFYFQNTSVCEVLWSSREKSASTDSSSVLYSFSWQTITQCFNINDQLTNFTQVLLLLFKLPELQDSAHCSQCGKDVERRRWPGSGLW